MTVFDLVAKLVLDTEGFDDGLDKSGEKAKGFLGKLGDGIGTAAKGAGIALAAVGTAAVGLTKSVVDGASEVAAYGDNIDKMSQKMGISAQAYQEWDAILQHSGSSIDGMQRGMMTLAAAAEKGSEAFDALGISQEDVAGMNQEELFSAVITGLQGMEEGTERAVLAQQLLGGAAKELGPLLNTSAEDTEEMRKRVHELGGVMSDEAVKSAAAYQDGLQDMQTAFKGLSRGLFSEFMPSITTVMGGLTEIFSGNGDEGIAQISQGIDALITDISDKVPEFLDLGLGILESLIGAIIDNLPKLLGASGKIIGKLIAGIIAALPSLIKQAPQIVKAIIDGLVAAWPDIREAGIELLDMLISGIDSVLNSLKDVADSIIGKIRDGISAGWSSLKNVGKSIIDGILQGLKDAWDSVKSWFSNAVSNLRGKATVEVDGQTSGTPKASGIDYVPYHDFPAILHKGEAVLNATDAEKWRRGENGTGGGGITIIQNIQAVPQTPVEFAAATEAYFEQARWAMA